MQQVAKDLQSEYGNRYIEAAKNFRIPYWDWALPANTGLGLFPEEALRSTKHNLTRPKVTAGQSVAVKEDNPLAYYTFGAVAKSEPKHAIDWVSYDLSLFSFPLFSS